MCMGGYFLFSLLCPLKVNSDLKKKSRNHTEKGGIQEPESVMDVRKNMPEEVTVELA